MQTVSMLSGRMIIGCACAVVFFCQLCRGELSEWPEFRGPTGQGLADAMNLPVRLDITRDATWKTAIPGKGWSSPICYRGRIYLTTAVPLDETNREHGPQSLRTVCVDAKTGDVSWDQEIFTRDGGEAKSIHTKNSHASPTPLTDGQRLYVHYGADGTAALDFDGQVVWINKEIRYNPQHGGGGSPILSGNLLVFHCDGTDDPFVIALRRDSGKVEWKTVRPETDPPRFSFATPLEIEVKGKRQIVSPASHQACSYDAETGTEIWRVRYPNKWSVIPRPVFAHGLVYICTGFDGPAELLAIRPDGQGDVTESHIVWKTDENVSHSPSILVVDDDLFMVSDKGIASCRDARTGDLHWRERLGGNYSASPWHAGGKIYFQSEQGICTVIAAAREFQELARSDFGESTLASHAVADGAVFVRTESSLYRFDTTSTDTSAQSPRRRR